ncbi:MAG TPA: caspase family protein [Gemmatimonadaceae bacterium]
MSATKGERRALLVGVGRYDQAEDMPALDTPLRDVRGMAAALRDPARCGFTDVRELPNPSSLDLCKKAEEIFGSAGRDDLILFYFSGHGRLSESGDLHLCATNTDRGALLSTSLPLSFLNIFVNRKPIAQIVIVLDCCYSGTAVSGIKGGDMESRVTRDLGQGQGKYVITSSSAVQVSLAKPDDDYSLFSKWLINGLKTDAADTDENGAITIEELFLYAKRRTMEEAPAQEPQSFTYAIKPGDVVIARSQGARKRVSGGQIISTNPAFFKAVQTRRSERRIIPFLGAGVYGNGALSAFQLSRAVGQSADLQGQSDLTTSAEYLVQLLDDRAAFLEQFSSIVERQSREVKRVATYDLVLSAPRSRLVISATYDMVLERQLQAQQVSHTIVSHIQNSRDGQHDGKLLVVHGGASTGFEILASDQFLMPAGDELVIYKVLGSPFLGALADPAAELDTVVVTESDHLTFVGRLENERTRVPNAFALPFQTSCILFLGYSLDLWHYRLTLKVLGHGLSRAKKIYAVRQPTSEMEELYWQRFHCDMIKGDPERFAEQFLTIALPMAEAV